MSESSDWQDPDSIEHAPSLEERVASCPIHAWVGGDMDGFLASGSVPAELRPLLQELLLVRGEYGADISAVDAKRFARRAEEIMFANGVDALSGRSLFMMFSGIAQQWQRAVREQK